MGNWLRRRRWLILGWAFLAGVVGVQGLYAGFLNRSYYASLGPFYDSVSYLNRLAEIMWIAREQGVAAALRGATAPANVMLPYLEAALLGVLLAPSRILAIWLQEVWILALACSLLWYLHRLRGVPLLAATAFTLPFFNFATVYWHSGGVSDFRMDLSLYIFLAMSAVWYLSTYETRAAYPWVLTAVAALSAVLARATAGAYLVMMFGPLLAARLASTSGEERGQLVKRLLWAGVPCMAACAAYYLTRWDYLHWYYFVWGQDPTAHLPFLKAARHFWFGLHHLGNALKLAAGVTLLLTLGAAVRADGWPAAGRRLDLRLVWLGAAPGALLAAMGAGPNRLVSMPMVFGVLLFCLMPLRGRHPLRRHPFTAGLCAILLAGASLVNAALGVERHRYFSGRGGEMAAFRQAIDLLRSDARRHGLEEARVVSTTIHDFATPFLENTLIYEHGGRPEHGTVVLPDGFRVNFSRQWSFAPVVPLDWERIPGGSDEEKFHYLVALASRELDYIFLPDLPTIDYLEQRKAGNFQNLKVRRLRRMLLASGRWEPVGEPIVVTPGEETLTLYRKRSGGAE